MTKQSEHDTYMDYLNYIDELAEQCSGDIDEQKQRATAYTIVADFIDKHAKR